MKKCLVCNQRKAIKHSVYGWLPCKICQGQSKPKQVKYELTTEEIKDSRKKYADDIVQPYRDGELSGEYVKRYPSRVKKMIEEGNITPEEVKDAKPVWDEVNYYHEE